MTPRAKSMILPVAGIVGGAGAIIAVIIARARSAERPMSDARSASVATGIDGKTGYHLIDAILPQLRAASQTSGIPLGLMVGWIAKESGGKLSSHTSLDERGLYQLMPDESKSLGLDHARLSTDSDYNVNVAGPAIVGKYMAAADKLGVAPKSSSYYWRLVKLGHAMGSGQVAKVVAAAKAAGRAGSWDDLESHALGMHINGPQPKKWFPLVDDVYKIGRQFGMGNESTLVAGAAPVSDEECLARMLASERKNGSCAELQAAAWATRNRARALNSTLGAMLVPTGEFGPQDATRPFASTVKPPTAFSWNVARAVCALPQQSDPTRGAVDFWDPAQHGQFKMLGDLYRTGNESMVGYAGYTANEMDVRADFARRGLRVVGVVGGIELIG